MNWTRNIDASISTFEQERGEILKPKVVELIKKMAAACDYFEKLGVKDAAAGQIQRTKEPFIEWAKRDLRDHYDDKALSIVDLMYTCYTDGYNRQKVG